MDLVIRATVIFAFVLLATRVVGRRELSSLEPFDLIMLVVIGDLVQQGVTQDDYSVTGALIVISTITLLTAVTAFLNFKVRPLRRVLEGEPVVLVDDGRILERNMARERITVEDLEQEGRQQQLTSVEDMRWAVLETTGSISVIPRKS